MSEITNDVGNYYAPYVDPSAGATPTTPTTPQTTAQSSVWGQPRVGPSGAWNPFQPAYNFTSVPFVQGNGQGQMLSKFASLPDQILDSQKSDKGWGQQYARWQFSNLGQGSPGPFGTPRGWGRWQTDPNWHYNSVPNQYGSYPGAGPVSGGNNLPGAPQNPIGGLGGLGGVTPGGTGSTGGSQTPQTQPTSPNSTPSAPVANKSGVPVFGNFQFSNAAPGTAADTFNKIMAKYGSNDAYNWMMNNQWNALGTDFRNQAAAAGATPEQIAQVINQFGAGGGQYDFASPLGGYNGGTYSWGGRTGGGYQL
jgi:hypothetical protein